MCPLERRTSKPLRRLHGDEGRPVPSPNNDFTGDLFQSVPHRYRRNDTVDVAAAEPGNHPFDESNRRIGTSSIMNEDVVDSGRHLSKPGGYGVTPSLAAGYSPLHISDQQVQADYDAAIAQVARRLSLEGDEG